MRRAVVGGPSRDGPFRTPAERGRELPIRSDLPPSAITARDLSRSSWAPIASLIRARDQSRLQEPYGLVRTQIRGRRRKNDREESRAVIAGGGAGSRGRATSMSGDRGRPAPREG